MEDKKDFAAWFKDSQGAAKTIFAAHREALKQRATEAGARHGDHDAPEDY